MPSSAPLRQSEMAKLPVPPATKLRLEAIRAQLQHDKGRTVNLAEAMERIIGAWETAEARRRELDEINETLRGAGITYPPGVRGVHELIRQRDEYLSELQERTG